jgi:hypothetical protein
MTTDVQRHRQPRLRLPRRPFDDNVDAVQTTDADADRAVTLDEFARRHSLPSVVRVVRGRFADIGCSSDDADAEIYVHSLSSAAVTSDTKTTVFAQVMRFADEAEFSKQQSTAWRSSRRHGNRGTATPSRRLIATGRTVCLPDDGIEVAGCWFELLSEDGRAAPPVRSVEELANRALRRPVPQVKGGDVSGDGRPTTRYLVRQTVFASVGSVSSTTLAIQPGETLTPLRVVTSPAGAPEFDEHHRQRRLDRHMLNLQCVDGRHRMVFLQFDQPGLFSPVVECTEDFPGPTPPLNGIGVVYDGIKSIISSCRLPVTVRIAAGRLSIPDSVGVSSGSPSPIFRLTGVSELDGAHRQNYTSSSSKKTQRDADDSRAVYVMSLRHAWSFNASVHASTGAVSSDAAAADDDDEWRRRLTAVPLSAARSLAVVAASRDFHISWLTTEDGRELARRCDRIIAGRLSAAAGGRSWRHGSTTPMATTRIDDGNDDDYDIHTDRRDHHARNTPRRQTSIDSGLASSALNDDLYDEIDHIYCMIRYGPDARPIIVEPPPEATRRQRVKSHDDVGVGGGGGAFHAGCRLEVGIGGYVPRGVAAVLNDRRSPELSHRMNGCDPISWTYAGRRPRDTAVAVRQTPAQTVTTISRFRMHNTHSETLKQQRHRPGSRPSSRCDGDVTATPAKGESRRTECDGRSETGRISRRSSVAVIAMDDEDYEIGDGFDNRDGRLSTDGAGLLSPLAIVSPTRGSGTSDRESGNVTAADVTTTSGESPTFQRNRGQSQSTGDVEATSVDPAKCTSGNAADKSTRQSPSRGRRSLSATRERTRKESTEMTEDRHSRTDINETPSSHKSGPYNGNGGGSRQNRKPAFVAVISQSLANALRRVGKRSTGNATLGGGSGNADAATSEAAHEASNAKLTGTVQSRKKRNGMKNGSKDRKSTTWYQSDAAFGAAFADDNNNSSSNHVADDDDDDLEVFDYDIGDGRPNVDFRREFNTARTRKSWAVGAVATAMETDAADPSTRSRRKTSDPPLLVAPRGGGGHVANGQTKRAKSPTILFDGHRGMRTATGRNNDLGAYVVGQYKNIGQY